MPLCSGLPDVGGVVPQVCVCGGGVGEVLGGVEISLIAEYIARSLQMSEDTIILFISSCRTANKL